MSEEALNRFLERWNTDEEFRERMRTDWEDAIDELGLSETELVALSTGDEDALRRLAGAEVSGFSAVLGGMQWTPTCHVGTVGCTTQTRSGCPATGQTGANCCVAKQQ